jgi:hypothetical protein
MLTSLERQRCTVLRSFCTLSAIWSRVAFSFLATVLSTSRSLGFRLYRHVNRSVHDAPFFVSRLTLSISSVLLFLRYKWYCLVLSIPQDIYLVDTLRIILKEVISMEKKLECPRRIPEEYCDHAPYCNVWKLRESAKNKLTADPR